ncbi:hypothetical protein [Pseudaquabacterium pictum]|uniref:DUF1801 domain-containing protein n=1 Tax=Pseudaquabacterium pictum TaxID=2315236 RepID=A0A480ATS0_9BURK|nr:hypothetical protein [Rubrivivax pictus]GCL62128.1 hypothetical protein AQPW35_12090 [Rubrivivax pictus]
MDGGAAPTPPALGKFKTGKGCINVQRLADIDQAVLAQQVAQAFAAKHG